MKILLPVVIIFFSLLTAVNLAFAQTWTVTSLPQEFWSSVASSADGTKLVAAAHQTSPPNGGMIYTSTNSGTTWVTNNVPNVNWISVASSADGTKLVAASGSLAGDGQIYTSTNAGAMWVSNNVPMVSWTSVSSSADGTKLVALAVTNLVYTSTNSGATWTSNSVPINVAQSLLSASSADGTRLVIAGDLGPVYISTNSGASWLAATNLPFEFWQAVVSSADGSKLAIVGFTNTIYTASVIYNSSDGGITWKSNSVSGIASWQGIASSANGSKLVVTARNGSALYVSKNSGATWTPATQNGCAGIISSADGAKLVAIPGVLYSREFPSFFIGPVVTSYSAPMPQLNLTSLTNNFVISWIVPSTNLVLQENLDLSTPNWVTLTNAPTLNFTNLQDQVILSPSSSNGFFRLIAQ